MHENCHRHPSELVEAHCRECAFGHCPDCLVYVGGPDSDPYCISCALAVAGVRGARPRKRSRRERRALRRQAHVPQPVAAATPTEPAPSMGGGIELPGEADQLTPAWATLDERSWNLGTG